jgi:cytochrome c oxidase cbb3-type subunit 4
MIKNVMLQIYRVEIYPIMALLIFTLFFAVIIWRALRMKRSEVNELSQLPLGTDDGKEGKRNHE